MFALGIVTLGWWGAAVAAPALMAARALRRGRRALEKRAYDQAEHWLEKASHREDLKEVALCLMAESALKAGHPENAIMALDGLWDQGGGIGQDASPRVLFLRGVACLALRHGVAAKEVLSQFAGRDQATGEERLAMVHACIFADDLETARQLLDGLTEADVGPALVGRLKLCRAAMHWARGRWREVLEALPREDECMEEDRDVAVSIRRLASQSLTEGEKAEQGD